MNTLDTGQRFPDMQASAVDGSTMTLPRDLGGHAAIVLFYRGHW